MKKHLYLSALLSICCLGVSQAQVIHKDTVRIHQAGATTPVLDGLVDDVYGGVPFVVNKQLAIPVSQACSTQAPTASIPFKVNFGGLWTYDSLYLIFTVQDPSVEKNDDIEIFMDSNVPAPVACDDSKSTWPPQYGSTANQIQYVLQDQNTVTATPSSGSSEGNAITGSSNYVYKKVAGGYNMEFRFSWNDGLYVFATTPPGAGTVLGFEVSSQDWEGGKLVNQLMWNDGGANRAWALTDSWGRMLLDPSPVAAVIKSALSGLVSNVSLYPNPSNGDFNIKVSALQADEVTISVMNSLSQKVFSQNTSIHQGDNFIPVNTSNFNSGMYTVVINKGGASIAEKIVINK
jgi:hypothetical protein